MGTQRPGAAARLPKPAIRWLGAAVAAAGMFFSYSLLQQSHGGTGSALLAPLCGEATDGVTDCQSVVNSAWGSWPISARSGSPRIPVAAFGLGYFAIFAAWFVFVGPPRRSRGWWLLPLALVALGGAMQSAQLVHAMLAVLKRPCVNCLIVHGLNALLLVLLVAAVPWTRRTPAAPPYPAHGHALAALTAGAAVFLIPPIVSLLLTFNGLQRYATTELRRIIDDPAFARWSYERQPAVDVPLAEGIDLVGPADAANTVIVFIDLQCERCKALQERLDRLAAAHPSSLRIGYRHFPLDPSCNDTLKRAMHGEACAAAQAVEAARRLGGVAAAEKMRRMIHAEPGLLGDGPLATFAATAGLDAAAFEAARRSAEVAGRVRDDIELAKRLGLSGAPHVYLNGRKLEYWTNEEAWTALLAGP